MSKLSCKHFWMGATERAIKTFCQTAVSLITVGNMITALDWMQILGISATSAIVSVLTSIATLEVEDVTD